ncbi:hypothetical protein EDEG_03898 [Edhazardia aedis USNM 41457]|uniref:Uncharacterized protein n=1 Tax=Edhazardia aedis (strain USNM 41457) TaxID=1003232 RepID=J9D1S5_EDHAE|nr:hypothetical protein EDEG_03898 [Edhazardia aedis USNM 41457]|eukprot:EJW01529.1 hypothetical protein EDEG_03898 [Edhazardia aedis USNM 41457]
MKWLAVLFYFYIFTINLKKHMLTNENHGKILYTSNHNQNKNEKPHSKLYNIIHILYKQLLVINFTISEEENVKNENKGEHHTCFTSNSHEINLELPIENNMNNKKITKGVDIQTNPPINQKIEDFVYDSIDKKQELYSEETKNVFDICEKPKSAKPIPIPIPNKTTICMRENKNQTDFSSEKKYNVTYKFKKRLVDMHTFKNYLDSYKYFNNNESCITSLGIKKECLVRHKNNSQCFDCSTVLFVAPMIPLYSFTKYIFDRRMMLGVKFYQEGIWLYNEVLRLKESILLSENHKNYTVIHCDFFDANTVLTEYENIKLIENIVNDYYTNKKFVFGKNRY